MQLEDVMRVIEQLDIDYEDKIEILMYIQVMIEQRSKPHPEQTTLTLSR